MKVKYDAETDVLRVIFDGNAIQESGEDAPGIIRDYDQEGNIVGLEILDASKRTENPCALEYAGKGDKSLVRFLSIYAILAVCIVVPLPLTSTWFPYNIMFHPGENEGINASNIPPLLFFVPLLLLPLTGIVHLIYIEAKRWSRDRLLTQIGQVLSQARN